MKIGVIHATNNAVSNLNNAIYKKLPHSKIINFIDENIQLYANEIDGIDTKTHRDFYRLAIAAEEAEVDIIIVACTVLTPVVDIVKPFINIPIIAVDQAMLEKAVKSHNKIGVVATTGPSGPAMKKQLEKIASNINKNIDVKVEINTDAMKELKKGNQQEHDILNYKSAEKLLKKDCEVIILAQITQATAKEKMQGFNIEVLTSPEEVTNLLVKVPNKINFEALM